MAPFRGDPDRPDEAPVLQPQHLAFGAVPDIDRTVSIVIHVAQRKQGHVATDSEPEITEIRIQPGVVDGRIAPVCVGQGLQDRIAGSGTAGQRSDQ